MISLLFSTVGPKLDGDPPVSGVPHPTVLPPTSTVLNYMPLPVAQRLSAECEAFRLRHFVKNPALAEGPWVCNPGATEPTTAVLALSTNSNHIRH